MQRVGVRAKLAYVAPAAVVWAGIYTAGIHVVGAADVADFCAASIQKFRVW